MEKKKKDIVANLLDLPELEPETTSVEITRLGIVFELKDPQNILRVVQGEKIGTIIKED